MRRRMEMYVGMGIDLWVWDMYTEFGRLWRRGYNVRWVGVKSVYFTFWRFYFRFFLVGKFSQKIFSDTRMRDATYVVRGRGCMLVCVELCVYGICVSNMSVNGAVICALSLITCMYIWWRLIKKLAFFVLYFCFVLNYVFDVGDQWETARWCGSSVMC